MGADLPHALDTKTHWEAIHSDKSPTQLSWYQSHAAVSVDLIKRTGADRSRPIIDIGGGISTLVDDLLAEGYTPLTVLDISGSALQIARKRLGELASRVAWVEADITRALLPERAYGVWHDRAAFHFLTQADERQRYVQALRRSLKPGGHVIVGTFALDGPSRCSGKEVVRYGTENLGAELGVEFALLDSVKETHVTPSGTEQRFLYCHFRREE